MTRCSICHSLVRPDEATTSCEECAQEYHAACWDGIGGCATYGCARSAVAEKPPPPTRLGGGWGDEKTCPACDGAIPSSLLICRCGAPFPHADPIQPEEYLAWLAAEQRRAFSRKALVLLFVFSLMGVTAPALGAVAGVHAARRRHELAGADGAYLALGYGTAALGAVYALVFLLLFVGR